VIFLINYFLTGFAAGLETGFATGLETGFATGFATGFEDAMNEILLSSTFIPLFKSFVAI
jgi:flagellar biosynthesis/type III secretory pathway protein FliH